MVSLAGSSPAYGVPGMVVHQYRKSQKLKPMTSKDTVSRMRTFLILAMVTVDIWRISIVEFAAFDWHRSIRWVNTGVL